MKVLFEQGTPVPLRSHLTDHHVTTAFELGWSSLKNGELLSNAEAEGFEVLITTDQNLQYQQDLSSRKIAIVVLNSTSWPRIKRMTSEIVEVVGNIPASGYVEVPIP